MASPCLRMMLYMWTNSISETVTESNKNAPKGPEKNHSSVGVTKISEHYQRAIVHKPIQLCSTLVEAIAGYHWRFWALADSAREKKVCTRGLWRRHTILYVGCLITKENKDPALKLSSGKLRKIRRANLLKAGYSPKYICFFYFPDIWIRRHALSRNHWQFILCVIFVVWFQWQWKLLKEMKQ